jgi:C_GCAxxG_C_C family probable redox protein
MQNKPNMNFQRRHFLISFPGLITGLPLLGQTLRQEAQNQEKALTAELSETEKKRVENSIMAEDLQKIFSSRKYSCAESILLASLHYLNEPDEMVWAAAGFGGGMGQRDLCGFLTGGIIGIGFAAGKMDVSRDKAKEYCSHAVKKYWIWWENNAPLHCRNIRTPERDSRVCSRLGQLAAAEVETLIS